jgi:hypothetical protein
LLPGKSAKLISIWNGGTGRWLAAPLLMKPMPPVAPSNSRTWTFDNWNLTCWATLSFARSKRHPSHSILPMKSVMSEAVWFAAVHDSGPTASASSENDARAGAAYAAASILRMASRRPGSTSPRTFSAFGFGFRSIQHPLDLIDGA